MPAAPLAHWSAGVPAYGSAGGPVSVSCDGISDGDACADAALFTAEQPAAPRQAVTATAIAPAVSRELRPRPGLSL